MQKRYRSYRDMAPDTVSVKYDGEIFGACGKYMASHGGVVEVRLHLSTIEEMDSRLEVNAATIERKRQNR